MAEEQGGFRRKVFGGFDQNDVINYIEGLSTQRNKFQTDVEGLLREREELRAQLSDMTARANNKDDLLTQTTQELSAVRKELDGVWNELRETRDELEAMRDQLDRANKELADKARQYENDLAAAQLALEEAKDKAKAIHIATVDGAVQILDELNSSYDGVKKDMDDTTEQLKREVGCVSDSMSALTAAFTAAGEKLDDLRLKTADDDIISDK